MSERSKVARLAGGAAVAVLILGLAACGDSKKTADPRLPPKGGSAAFDAGFKLGCVAGVEDADHPGQRLSGAETGPAKESAARYATDLQYKDGWDKGYFACYDDESS